MIWFADGLALGNHTVEITNVGYAQMAINNLAIDYAIVS